MSTYRLPVPGVYEPPPESWRRLPAFRSPGVYVPPQEVDADFPTSGLRRSMSLPLGVDADFLTSGLRGLCLSPWELVSTSRHPDFQFPGVYVPPPGI